ncbi:MAG: hypothetical protein WDW36_001359 [Sanguina aurantia]
MKSCNPCPRFDSHGPSFRHTAAPHSHPTRSGNTSANSAATASPPPASPSSSPSPPPPATTPRTPPDAATQLATAQLTELGCTPKQVSRVLSTLAAKGHPFDFQTAERWLQILSRYGVPDPLLALVNNALLLQTRPEEGRDNAPAVTAWVAGMGLTQAELGETLARYPQLLCLRHTDATEAVSQWLTRELGWDGRQIVKALHAFPPLFACSPAEDLTPRLKWFFNHGFHVAAVGRAMLETPDLFSSSIAHYESQLSALQALGLTPSQVQTMVLKEPSLFTTSVTGEVMQLKVRFLVEVMGKQVADLVNCPVYLLRSLKGCIGPRWAFAAQYGTHLDYQLSARLRMTDRQFAEAARSTKLNGEFKSRAVTRIQVYSEFKIRWQQGAGKGWCGVVKEETAAAAAVQE